MAATFDISELVARPDHAIAVSDWIGISQERIDRFADVTGDTQWIHTDPARASASSPFRVTIAHGFLTLSLLSHMASTAMSVADAALVVNCGLNRVRFTSPVTSGCRVRGHFAVADLASFDGGRQVTWNVTVERDPGQTCCVAEWIVRYYRSSTAVS